MIYKKDSYVSGSMCDTKLKLSLLSAGGIVENAVTELMGDLGIDGIVAKEKYQAMWVINKNKITFLRRPVWRETFTVTCFISHFSVVRLNLDTLVHGENGELLMKARTELAAIGIEDFKIRRISSVGFTEDMAHPAKDESMAFLPFPASTDKIVETLTVRSTSLDYCYHTNNLEYVRFVLATYTGDYFKTHEPQQMEVSYHTQSFEGETLTLEKQETENGDVFFIKRDGAPVTDCRLKWEAEA